MLHWLLKGGPEAQREAKLLVQKQTGMTPAAQTIDDRRNARLIARLRVSPEGQEGLSAFLDKRQPMWARGTGA
ncbi:enoyl-CoA hydratase [compost metagenome]